ncbi:hypothetical protein Tco_0236933 [Tanacetum coccineum]
MNTIVLLLHLIRRREEEGINHLKQGQDMLVIKICVIERKKEERKVDLRKFVARGSVFRWGGLEFIEDKNSRYSAGVGKGKVKDPEAKGHTDSADQLYWDPKYSDLISTESVDVNYLEMEELTIFIKGEIRDAMMPLHAYELIQVDATIYFKLENLEEAVVLDVTSVDPQELCTERVALGKAILADLWLGATLTCQVLVLFHPLGEQLLNL